MGLNWGPEATGLQGLEGPTRARLDGETVVLTGLESGKTRDRQSSRHCRCRIRSADRTRGRPGGLTSVRRVSQSCGWR